MIQPRMTLNDGNFMPQLGVGVWQVPEADTARVVRDALAIGYRLFDGAAAYKNETGLGEGLRQTGVLRDQLFVTSKLWNSDHGHDAALRACEASLDRLGLDYMDLYLIHWPVPAADLYVDSWRALIRLKEEGRVRSIGVANFHEAHLRRLIDETGVTPAVNQIELHPTLTQTELRQTDRSLGIVTQSWSPLGRGDLDLPELRTIAEQHGCTPAQVVLRWHLQNDLSVIPKSVSAERLAENFHALDVELSGADMAVLDGLDRGHRTGPDPDTFDMR
ncbi:aldo/keto reductase [uncultured Paracoccus sp.]|uniref:aldo/keto reductase n=1 Tax=uncultured Paracoccus sp. TaxID=189685 RepID=UPI00260663D5|nr:aldo/keto reductase [uncultured Paracoccus sp.]